MKEGLMLDFRDWTRDDLLLLLDVYAKNWLAHDGCWFLAAEEKYGLATAIELDRKSWERFAPAEARRIMQTFGITAGGLASLEKALNYRLYAMINKPSSRWTEDGALEFRMNECRVQATRRRKGLPDFPCKPVGIVEFSGFAAAIDPRIRTECVACPPDPVGEAYCTWRFTI